MKHLTTIDARQTAGPACATAAALLVLALAVSPAVAGSVYVLDSDVDATQSRVDLIQQAQEQVLAAYFIFADDPAGTALIADGHQLITGGRNIEGHYFGVSAGLNYVDRDVFVSGDAAVAAQEYFLALWDSRHVQKLKKKRVSPAKLEQAVAQLDAAENAIRDRGRVQLATGTDWSAQGRKVPGVRFLHDPVARERKQKDEGIRADLVEILRGARESVLVENPYVVPTRKFMKNLESIVEKGVQVRLLTNSLKVCDSVMAQSGYVGKRKKLVRAGVELWEYTGPKTVHSKSVVVDGRITIIGSYNLDPRSRSLNTEVSVVIEDTEIAAITAASMQSNLESAWRIGADGKPEGHDKKNPEASLSRRFRVGLYKLLLPLTRRQL